eukprot:GHRR01002177.1.p1 GENE.GHRR01002177.1~~GHRR01002177.1.p1  ORF type:complete len:1461 (+),score=576.75 GHRR01002177.1:827-5209(+)
MAWDFLRRIVSGQKRRFQAGPDGFDLDLAYIAPRVIAMGLPAEGTEGLYRNPMAETARFLQTYHRDRAKVYNLCSEHYYHPNKLLAPVKHLPFDDHQTPPLQVVQQFCSDAAAWLVAHPHNVVVVHCKAGKGRTGIMICCLLMYLHLHGRELANLQPGSLVTVFISRSNSNCSFGSDNSTGNHGSTLAGSSGPEARAAEAAAAEDDIEQQFSPTAAGPSKGTAAAAPAGFWHPWQFVQPVELQRLAAPVTDLLQLYAERRTHDGNGISIPSQRRYVAYFWRVLSLGKAPCGILPAPQTLQLRELIVSGLPAGGAASCTVVIEARPSGSNRASPNSVLMCQGPRAVHNGIAGLCFAPCVSEPGVFEGRMQVAASLGGHSISIRLPAANMGLGPLRTGLDNSTNGWSRSSNTAAAADSNGMPGMHSSCGTLCSPPGRAAVPCDANCGGTLANLAEATATSAPAETTQVVGDTMAAPAATRQAEAAAVPATAGTRQLHNANGSPAASVAAASSAPDALSDRGVIPVPGCCVVEGDVRISVFKGSVRLFHTWFNTAFLPPSGCITLDRSQLDKPAKTLPKGVSLSVRFMSVQPVATADVSTDSHPTVGAQVVFSANSLARQACSETPVNNSMNSALHGGDLAAEAVSSTSQGPQGLSAIAVNGRQLPNSHNHVHMWQAASNGLCSIEQQQRVPTVRHLTSKGTVTGSYSRQSSDSRSSGGLGGSPRRSLCLGSEWDWGCLTEATVQTVDAAETAAPGAAAAAPVTAAARTGNKLDTPACRLFLPQWGQLNNSTATSAEQQQQEQQTHSIEQLAYASQLYQQQWQHEPCNGVQQQPAGTTSNPGSVDKRPVLQFPHTTCKICSTPQQQVSKQGLSAQQHKKSGFAFQHKHSANDNLGYSRIVQDLHTSPGVSASSVQAVEMMSGSPAGIELQLRNKRASPSSSIATALLDLAVTPIMAAADSKVAGAERPTAHVSNTRPRNVLWSPAQLWLDWTRSGGGSDSAEKGSSTRERDSGRQGSRLVTVSSAPAAPAILSCFCDESGSSDNGYLSDSEADDGGDVYVTDLVTPDLFSPLLCAEPSAAAASTVLSCDPLQGIIEAVTWSTDAWKAQPTADLGVTSSGGINCRGQRQRATDAGSCYGGFNSSRSSNRVTDGRLSGVRSAPITFADVVNKVLGGSDSSSKEPQAQSSLVLQQSVGLAVNGKHGLGKQDCAPSVSLLAVTTAGSEGPAAPASACVTPVSSPSKAAPGTVLKSSPITYTAALPTPSSPSPFAAAAAGLVADVGHDDDCVCSPVSAGTKPISTVASSSLSNSTASQARHSLSYGSGSSTYRTGSGCSTSSGSRSGVADTAYFVGCSINNGGQGLAASRRPSGVSATRPGTAYAAGHGTNSNMLARPRLRTVASSSCVSPVRTCKDEAMQGLLQGGPNSNSSSCCADAAAAGSFETPAVLMQQWQQLERAWQRSWWV